MPSLTVKIVGTTPGNDREVVLAQISLNEYSPSLDSVLGQSLDMAASTLNLSDEASLMGWQPEVSVALSGTEGERVRPSLQLGKNVIARLASAGATFDFDPYV
jgi:hypothetical protein